MLVVLPIRSVVPSLSAFGGRNVITDGRSEFVGRRHIIDLFPLVDIAPDGG